MPVALNTENFIQYKSSFKSSNFKLCTLVNVVCMKSHFVIPLCTKYSSDDQFSYSPCHYLDGTKDVLCNKFWMLRSVGLCAKHGSHGDTLSTMRAWGACASHLRGLLSRPLSLEQSERLDISCHLSGIAGLPDLVAMPRIRFDCTMWHKHIPATFWSIYLHI